LKIRNVEGYRNYDKSEFESPSALLDGDENELLTVCNSQHKLSEFLDREKNFKSYDALKKRLDEVLSGAGSATKSAAKIAEDDDDLNQYAAPEAKSAPAPAAKTKAAPIDDDDDDALSYFQKMAQD
jgi:transglutaminase-like putative cysteine protease